MGYTFTFLRQSHSVPSQCRFLRDGVFYENIKTVCMYDVTDVWSDAREKKR